MRSGNQVLASWSLALVSNLKSAFFFLLQGSKIPSTRDRAICPSNAIPWFHWHPVPCGKTSGITRISGLWLPVKGTNLIACAFAADRVLVNDPAFVCAFARIHTICEIADITHVMSHHLSAKVLCESIQQRE